MYIEFYDFNTSAGYQAHINEVHKLMEKYGLTVKDLVK